jgi:hypothetical protein
MFASLLILLLVHPVVGQQAADETAAVAKRVKSYVAAFNSRDVAACTEHWSKAAEYSLGGVAQPVVGRKAIGEALTKLLATDEQFEMSVSNQRFRAVAENVVTEDGIAQLVSETHGVEYARYLVVHVKQNGAWYRDSIRETLLGTIVPSDSDADELESLIGTFGNQSDEGSLAVKATWMHDKRFISRTFELQDKQGHKVTATEIIGWDPAARVIRSWSFDSQGGFEQAVWNRDGDQWLIKANGVLPNGSTATEQRMLSVDSNRNLNTQVIEQQIAGRLLPGAAPTTLTRKPSKPVNSK